MNIWQLLQQVRYLVRLQTWPSSSNVVFHSSSVICSEHADDEAIAEAIAPLCLISVGGGAPDGETPALRSEDIKILLAVINENDRLGEGVLIGGGGRVATGSAGRGLLEIQERVEAAIAALSAVNGIRTSFVAASNLEARRHPTLGQMAAREYVYRAWVGIAKTYQPATSFKATSGTAAMTWKAPGDRYDSRRAILRRASGSTAPASATAGTGITLGGTPDGNGVVSKTDTPGSGTWSYSLWYAYDEFGSSTDEAYSAGLSLTTVIP